MLKFDEETHTYTYEDKKLISVTTFLGQFFSKFDRDAIAQSLSERFGRPAEEYIEEWEEASNHGTRVHNAIEQYVLNNLLKAEEAKEKDEGKIEQGIEFLKELDIGLCIPEYKIYDLELGLAGTIDLIVVTPEGLLLVDWKTNKAIRKSDFDFETRQVKKCSKPISGTNDCNYEKYVLQLSTYAYMLERKGYTIAGLKLVHLKDTKRTEYDIDYKKKKVKRLLEHGKRDN